MRSSSRLLWRVERRKMTRTELIVQLLKIAIGLVFGAYFVWGRLQVLDRLTPEQEGSAVMIDPSFLPMPARAFDAAMRLDGWFACLCFKILAAGSHEMAVIRDRIRWCSASYQPTMGGSYTG